MEWYGNKYIKKMRMREYNIKQKNWKIRIYMNMYIRWDGFILWILHNGYEFSYFYFKHYHYYYYYASFRFCCCCFLTWFIYSKFFGNIIIINIKKKKTNNVSL